MKTCVILNCMLWLILCLVLCSHLGAQQQTNSISRNWITTPAELPDKLFLAHICGWSFDFDHKYDSVTKNPLWQFKHRDDRSTLGKWQSTKAGHSTDAVTDIQAAMKFGIDGFCVDIAAPPTPTGLGDGMNKFFRASEGTPFKITVCPNNYWGPVERMTTAMLNYLNRWTDHPNQLKIDGRPVVFIYNPSTQTKMDEWEEVDKNLQAHGHNVYWLGQIERETTLWGDRGLFKKALKTFDGIYDFGSNGFTAADLTTKLKRGKSYLKDYTPSGKGKLVASITQGYIGSFTGYVRPYLNYESMRNNWRSALAADADWICLTTWDDYVENTAFAPTIWNSESLARIQQDYVRLWRNEPVPQRNAQVHIAYRNEVLAGDDWTLEILSMPYTTETEVCEVKITDILGNDIKVFAPFIMPTDHDESMTYRIKDISRLIPQHFRVWARSYPQSQPDHGKWKHLYPVRIRANLLREYITAKIYLNKVLANDIKLSKNNNTLQAEIKQGYCISGEIMFMVNALNIDTVPVHRYGPPPSSASTKAIDYIIEPVEMYTALFRDDANNIAYSNPVFVEHQPESKTKISIPIFVSNSDFDEDWPIWSHRQFKYNIVQRKFDTDQIFDFTIPMNDGPSVNQDTYQILKSQGPWNVQSLIGMKHIHGGSTALDKKPTWQTSEVFGKSRPVLQLDGNDDVVIFPQWTMPIGAFSLELLFKPNFKNEQMRLFDSGNGALSIIITPEHKLNIVRNQAAVAHDDRSNILASKETLTQQWYHLAVIYQGDSIKTYINGRLDSEMTVTPGLCRINALPVLGGSVPRTSNYDQCYKGEVAGLRISGQVLEPQGFELLTSR